MKNLLRSTRTVPLARRAAVLWVTALLTACAIKEPPVVYEPPSAGPPIQIAQLDRGVQIVIPTEVIHFDVNQATFDPAGAAPYLTKLADLLNRKTQKRLSVEGHTDSDGNASLNEALSVSRALAVREALAQRGLPQDRMEHAGFSFNRPVASNATRDGKRLNRRVEIIVIDERVENLTAGEPPGMFARAFDELKDLVERGLVKPAAEGQK